MREGRDGSGGVFFFSFSNGRSEMVFFFVIMPS